MTRSASEIFGRKVSHTPVQKAISGAATIYIDTAQKTASRLQPYSILADRKSHRDRAMAQG